MQRTELEQHEDNKESFKKLMPLLAGLNEFEQRSLIHLLKNRERSKVTLGKECEIQAIEDACSNAAEVFLAKKSEEANYEKKNRLLH